MAFLPVTLLVYFLIPGRHIMARNTWLLMASLVFYGWGEPKYILVMLASIIANYVLAIGIGNSRKTNNEHGAKLMLILDVVINLALLGFFKYTDFIIETVNSLADSDFGLLGIALPIGISFYTFQTMSYVIDVYRGKVESQKNLIILATYITLFPQLIAGPIVRYSDVEAQLKKRTSDTERISEGIRRFIIGFSKKILIANQMAVIWEEIYGYVNTDETPGAALLWIGAIAFTFQIYFDFSGYSDMAIGLGKIFGFDYLENFNYPYISSSITEFWRRWHMSLSSWFKEYVYIPLGGNRKGLIRQLINIAIVWALTGLWHGASWNFVLWGVYYGILLIIEKLFLLKLLGRLKGGAKAIGHIYAMFFVIVGWVIFNITDFSVLGKYLVLMFGAGSGDMAMAGYYLSSKGVLFIIALICSTPAVGKVYKKIGEKIGNRTAGDILETVIFAVLFIISIAYLVSGSYNPFLYFRF